MTFSPPAPEVDARPERVVQAARDLANETGSAAFTVAQLTNRAGVSLKAFYGYFRSKDDLLLALLGADSALGAEVLTARIGTRTGPAAVEAYVVGLFDMIQLPGALGYAGVLVREYRRLIELHDEEQRAALAPLVELLAGHLDSPDPARRRDDVLGAGGRHSRCRDRTRHQPRRARAVPPPILHRGSALMAVDDRVMRHLHKAAGGETHQEATLLPDPEQRERTYTIISVDDHLIEPANVFEGRMPAHLQEHAPKVIEFDNGRETWVYEDAFYPQVGLNAVAGRPKDQWSMEPARFDEMRRGCYDIEARVADMDLDGVYASLCFPSLIAGFAGTIFANSKDPELGLRLCARGTTGTSRNGPARIPTG